MIKFHYYLKEKAAKTTYVQATLVENKQRKRIGIGLMIETAKWDFKKERYNKNKSLTIADQEDNKRLDEIESVYQNNRNLEIDELAKVIKEFVTTGSIVPERTIKNLEDAFNLIIQESQNGKGTIKSYIGTRNIILKFQNPTLEMVDLSFQDNFVKFLYTKEIAKNTIGRHVKNIKAIMMQTFKRNLHQNLAFKDFKVSSEKVDNIALTEAEIERLINLKLVGQEELIRDLFVLGCYTGLRFSDFDKIKVDSIKNGILTIAQTQKTGEQVVVPLKTVALSIITRYGVLPKIPDNQTFNRTIKRLAKKAKISGAEVFSRTQGAVRISTTKDRSDLVKTHTARRSFATNAFKAGLQTLSIMKITGHRTEKAFLDYIKIGKQEHAELIANHPFFN